MRMRSGDRKSIASGTIVVNCTGSFFRAEQASGMPCLSPHTAVASINARDSMFFLTSVCGFFLTHLLYRDKLRGEGFCTLDHDALFRANRNAWVGASAAQAYMTQTLAVQRLPLMLLYKCGLDLDRWYPLPRRMGGPERTMRAAFKCCGRSPHHSRSLRAQNLKWVRSRQRGTKRTTGFRSLNGRFR